MGTWLGKDGKERPGGTFLFCPALWTGWGDLTLAYLKQEKASGEHAATIFQKAWSIYDFLAEKNYMHHREIYARVEAWLGRRKGESYSLLDLGCGNARFLAPCLERHPPSLYVGVDLSGAALEEARDHLKGLLHVSLREEEMLEALAKDPPSFKGTVVVIRYEGPKVGGCVL